MAVAVQTSSTLTGASAASAVVTLPSGITADDIVVVSLYKENTAAVTPPSGFAEKGTAPTTTSPITVHTFWKRMSGGESGTVTFTWAGSVWREASAVRISGVHTTGDPIAQFTSAQSNGASSLNASFTMTTANSLLYAAMGDFTSSTDFTPPSGFTENYDGGDLGDSWKANTAGGATGTLTYTATNFSGVVMTLIEILAPTYLNHATVAMPRNGTAAHTAVADGTGGTVVDGTGFSPTAGRLLLCFAEGSVTTYGTAGGPGTAPAGWTLPTNGAAINNTGLYVFTRTADGTSADQVVTTHNASDYPVVYDFYEFPAGSTFVGANNATGIANNSSVTGPTLGGLTGTNWTAGAAAQGISSVSTVGTTSWVTGSEEVDTSVLRAGTGPTDGYCYSLGHINEDTTATAGMAANIIPSATTLERLIVAVKLPATAAAAVSPDIPLQHWPAKLLGGRWPWIQRAVLSPSFAVVNDFVGDAALSVTETTTVSGQTQGVTSLTGTATITAAGGAQGAASLAVTDAITAAGQTRGAVAFTATATITASGVVATSASATLAETASITAAGIVATASAASLTVTANITAVGSLGGTDFTGTASSTTTATITASGLVSTTATATRDTTAAVTAVGVTQGSTTRSTTATITTAGATQSVVALTITATRVAAGVTQNTSSVTVTATITAAGSLAGGALTGTATLTETVTIAAAGNLSAVGTAAVAETVTISAVGNMAAAKTVTLTSTATITAVGALVLLGEGEITGGVRTGTRLVGRSIR